MEIFSSQHISYPKPLDMIVSSYKQIAKCYSIKIKNVTIARVQFARLTLKTIGTSHIIVLAVYFSRFLREMIQYKI